VVERPLNLRADLVIRNPDEDDHRALVGRLGAWWAERPLDLPRLWLRHFAGTSWVAATPDGSFAGLAVGFASQDRADTGVLLAVAVAPAYRRQGLGRELVGRVERSLRDAGATRAEAVIWPGNRVAIRFVEAVGYEPIPESRATPLYGVPALADYDGIGEDRAVYVRELSPAAG